MALATVPSIFQPLKTTAAFELPPHDTKRWVPARKAQLVAAIKQGVISRDEALKRYALSDEEFQSWQQAFDQHGINGLKITRLLDYRNNSRKED